MDIHQLLESVASAPQWPDRPFLSEGLTFAQVYDQAAAISGALKQAGGQQTPVCLCVENRAYMAAAMLASLNGAPPLLFPYACTAQTLMAARQNIRYSHAMVEKAYPLPSEVKCIPIPEPMDASGVENRYNAMDPDGVWVYLFTGGSTGSPKIWSKSPRNLLMEAANLAKAFNIRNTDIILATVAPNHIYGLLYAVLLPLVSGAAVSVRTPSFPNEITQALDETNATVFISIPAHYRALHEVAVPPHHIHTAFSSAGALPEEDDRNFYGSTGIAVTEIYGSTETGGIAFRRRNSGQPMLRPFSYVSVHIEDERLRVRSDFLSKELQRDNEGFFLTADRVAQTDPDGFEILGRSDGIVKVGGKRVDLMEIRQAIINIRGVKDACVFAMPANNSRENEIVAVVEGPLDFSEIANSLKKYLISYAYPRRIKVVDKIPRSSSGKYDRNAMEKIVKSAG